MKLFGKMRNKFFFVFLCGDDSYLSRDLLLLFYLDESLLGIMYFLNDNLVYMNEIYKKEIF